MQEKRVLILAYDFPPYVSVGGLRPYAWYKYLRECGVYPVVITRQWANRYGNALDYIAAGESDEVVREVSDCGTIIRTPYRPNWGNRLLLHYGEKRFKWLRKLISGYYEIMQYYFTVGPKKKLYREACRYLAENKVDAIVATGDPFVLFCYASKLSKRYNVPWMADYRDPWTSGERDRLPLLGWLNARWERRFARSATCAITVSEFFSRQIAPQLGSVPIHIIPNGFDEDMLPSVTIAPPAEVLRIAFVGTIYEYHPIETVIRTFAQFAEANPEAAFEFNMFGINREELVGQLLDKYPSAKAHVHVFPRMANKELMAKLAEHHLMLLFNYYAIIGTKIYDYVGIHRRIWLCFTQDEEARALRRAFYPIKENAGVNEHLQADMLRDTEAGVAVKDSGELLQLLHDAWSELREKGEIVCTTRGAEQFSRRGGARKLAALIKD